MCSNFDHGCPLNKWTFWTKAGTRPQRDRSSSQLSYSFCGIHSRSIRRRQEVRPVALSRRMVLVLVSWRRRHMFCRTTSTTQSYPAPMLAQCSLQKAVHTQWTLPWIQWLCRRAQPVARRLAFIAQLSAGSVLVLRRTARLQRKLRGSVSHRPAHVRIFVPRFISRSTSPRGSWRPVLRCSVPHSVFDYKPLCP